MIIYGTKNKNSAKYIQHLQANDLLETRSPEGHYSFFKIKEVKGDTVFLRANKQESTNESGVYKLATDDNSFEEEIYLSTQQSIEEKFAKKEIVNVVRK